MSGGSGRVTGRIIQFGTSRFLQAHVGVFVHEARVSGEDVGPIAVVQASNSTGRAGRVEAFGRPEGYPVLIRGIENGVKIDRRVDVLSVDRGLSAVRDWDDLSDCFATEADFVVSNMGDTGYEIADGDRGVALLSGEVPESFPGKLTALLHRRWRDGARPLTVLPCELVHRNGRILEDKVLALAADAGAPSAFAEWIAKEIIFAETLVDRIVSQPLEPIGAIAEPYALWAIKRDRGLSAPCVHPAIVLADELESFERLKLHILNLGHTVLADIWLSEGRSPNETVREILSDAAVAERLDHILQHEVLPGFAVQGMEAEARGYIATTLDRFRNPFLDHRISDIAQNHAVKVDRRIVAFLKWIAERGHAPATPKLDAFKAR
ncbi:MAG: altronate oxidoreductase [Tardiphaga sp.]|nr:altronate oxidoreductase [Tardiphaga sp.]